MHHCGVIRIISIAQVRFVVKYRHCDGSLVLKITDDKVVSMKLAYGDLVSSIIYGLVPRPHPARISPACDTESDMETWRNEGPYRISCSLARSNDTPLPPNQAIVGQGGDLKHQWPL